MTIKLRVSIILFILAIISCAFISILYSRAKSTELSSVKSPIAGTVAKLFHAEGDLVKKDEPLLAVKPNPTPEDYITIKQQIDIDIAKEKQYAADVTRYQILLKRKVILPSDQKYSEAISAYKQARLQREIDEKN